MKDQEQIITTQTEIESIKKVRLQLNNYLPVEGTLEVIFKLPDGEIINVPVTNRAKIRLLSKEVRNYLAEEQLVKQCIFN